MLMKGHHCVSVNQLEFFLKNLFICGCAESLLLQGLLSSCGEQGTTLHVLHGLIIAVASLVADRGF